MDYRKDVPLPNDPLWYKDAIIYQLHVRAPSPLKDDGYDIADYTGIHPSYGSLRDFEIFIQEAHRRGSGSCR